MQVVLIILSVGLLGVIIYFAVSPKSSRLLRLSSLIALGLIGLSLGVCGIFLIRGPGEEAADAFVPVFQETSSPSKSSNAGPIVAFLVIFAAIMALIVFLALRDQRKKGRGTKGGGKAPVFQKNDDLGLEETVGKIDDEDSFEIEIE